MWLKVYILMYMYFIVNFKFMIVLNGIKSSMWYWLNDR